MCYYITVSTASEINITDGQVVFIEKFENMGGGHVHNQYRNVYSLTKNGCSCDIYHALKNECIETDHILLYNKLKKKKWSDSKIRRAIEGKQRANENADKSKLEIRKSFMEIVKSVKSLDLISHSHSKGFNDEPFSNN